MYTKILNGALESRINAIFGICLYLNKAYVQFSLFLKVCLLYHFKYMNAHTWQWIDLSSWPLTNYTSSQSWGLTRLSMQGQHPPTLALCTANSGRPCSLTAHFTVTVSGTLASSMLLRIAWDEAWSALCVWTAPGDCMTPGECPTCSTLT